MFAAPTYAEGDPELENALLYRNGYASTLVKSPKTLPFYLMVTKEGTGYLVDFPPDPDPLTPLKLEANGVPCQWDYAIGKLQDSKGWKDISDSAAKKIWGNPTINSTTVRRISTFSAPGLWNGEENIYHIDFCFDTSTGRPIQYRVRGIGISDAQFIPGPPSKKQ